MQAAVTDLQTNGIALDDEWVAFLKKHGFHVGLSIDGPRELHDYYRKTRSGKPTFDYVLSAAKKLAKAEVPFAALCVVNRQNAKQPEAVYRIGRLTASYIHFYMPSNPQAAAELLLP